MSITLSTQTRILFTKLNWARVNKAKGTLIWMMNRVPGHMKGDVLLLIRLLDMLQEFAVKELKQDGDEVWGTMEEAVR